MHSENFKDSKDFKDSEETSVHRRNNNIEIMIGNEIDEIIKNLSESLLQRHQEGLEEPIRGSNLFYNGVNLFYYKLHKISSNRSGSYTDSPKWLKNKKATINLKSNDDKCFQCALTVALNYQNIRSNPESLTKIKPFIDQYNLKERNFPSPRKKLEKVWMK